MSKILLHTCCGPCFLGSFEGLKNQGLQITNLFYNPNIQPEEEFKKRLDNLKLAVTNRSEEILILPYDAKEHEQAINGKEKDFPGRCSFCYELRLRKTAKEAKKNNFNLFSTTLLISPFQQHEVLKNLGHKIAQEEGIEFFYQDLRPFFNAGQRMAKDLEIYRQKYCGCLYSKEYK